ncbi:MAG TPA: TauD/TfdA family dioxygenase [Steroidobacteraceae bacterium]|nr:TauD/TfdA family dioxygenase [Steroidobacteraceae bacterium]
MDSITSLRIRELKPGFGAEVLDVDLARADSETIKEVARVFELHGVLLVRDQKMQPADLMRFLGHFGVLEDHTLQQFTLKGFPKIYLLSNRTDPDGRPIGAHNDGIGWHTDYSYMAEPVKCTMLYAVEVPAEGSDTLVADCCGAWRALPEDRKSQLQGLSLHHSYKYFMATREHGRMMISKEIEAATPDVIHPLIRTHPADGRKALWPSTGTVIEVVGMPGEAGMKLLNELVAFVTEERFVLRHRWRVGDIFMFDNRCTLHTGTPYDDQKYYRVMHRMWVKGDRPY